MIEFIVDEWSVRATAAPSYSKDRERRQKEEKRNAESLKKQIERHCDDYEYVQLDCEGHHECTFCGSTVADKTDYQCCEESIAEHDKENDE